MLFSQHWWGTSRSQHLRLMTDSPRGAGIPLLLHRSDGRRLWPSNSIPTLAPQQPNNVGSFKFKLPSLFTMIFAMSSTALVKPKVCTPENNLCRGSVPAAPPDQPGRDPELNLTGKGPLSTIPAPAGLVTCLLTDGSLWYTWDFRWEKTHLEKLPVESKGSGTLIDQSGFGTGHLLKGTGSAWKSFLLSMSCKGSY